MATTPQSDPWAEAAKNYKPQTGGQAAPQATGPNEDWKMWQQQDQSPKGNSGFFGPVQDLYDSAVSKPSAEDAAKVGPVGRSVANFGRGVMELGQPLMHPVKTVTAMGDAQNNRSTGEKVTDALLGPGAMLRPLVSGAVKDVKENGPAEAIPHQLGNLAGGIIAGETPGLAGDAAEMIPSRARAGTAFESLNADLAQHPVTLNATLKPLQRITEIGERSSNLPAPVTKFLQRSQSPIPMTFPEARDYQGGLSDLSAADKMGMPNRVKGALSQLNKGLYDDMKASADTAGRGEDYANAMKEYRQASQLKNIAVKGGKAIATGAAGAAGLGLAHRFLTQLSDR